MYGYCCSNLLELTVLIMLHLTHYVVEILENKNTFECLNCTVCSEEYVINVHAA